MLAIIAVSGSQFKVKAGDKIEINRLEEKEGDTIIFDKVVLLADEKGEDVKIGTPYLEGQVVEAKILKHYKGKKVTAFKKKKKKRYVRTLGHRQELTKVEIVNIKTGVEKEKKETPAVVEVKAVKKEEKAKEAASKKTTKKKTTKKDSDQTSLL